MNRRVAWAAIAAFTVTALPAAAASPVASAQDQVTLTIGLTQPWETLNPLVGYAVSEYEFWNVQYLGLTARSADDFSPTPGLAESWVEDEPGLKYTYTMREGQKWSDGEPITAEDIAWNINTSRDQEWTNYISTVENLTAEVVDERTVTVTSSVPDPKLPAVEIYIIPKHIWEPISETGEIESYEALDGVGSGPFVLDDYKSEESLTMVANENFYSGRRPIDRVIFRYFSNPDAMVAALERSEIDAAHDLPASAMDSLGNDPNIEVVNGLQGGFDQIAINMGAGPAQPHPALLDLEFRKAINYAIDKQAATEDLWFGLAEPATTISVGADFKWIPEIPEDEQLSYDPAKAISTLDAAGYLDTDGDGIREMPGGGDNIVLHHAVNTDGDLAPEMGELFSGWMKAVGIGVQLDAYDQDQLYGVITDATYDSFFWGWTPFVDPNPMLVNFTAGEIGNFNDANWTNERYDELYLQQQQELDPARRLEIVHEMVRIMYDDAGYIAMWYAGDLQGYRTDTFEGYVRQPAEVGPVLFSNSSPSYASLQPVGLTAEDDGGSNVVTIAIVVAAVVLLGVGGFAILRRRKSADDRE